jgi:hypothetical protein
VFSCRGSFVEIPEILRLLGGANLNPRTSSGYFEDERSFEELLRSIAPYVGKNVS